MREEELKNRIATKFFDNYDCDSIIGSIDFAVKLKLLQNALEFPEIKNGANLLESHVFQFDFLNDDFSLLPKSLQDVINDPKLRKKLIIYINPPYAEATNYKGNTKVDVAKQNKIFSQYSKELDGAMNELFAQFFIRIFKEIPNSKLAAFSKLKYISAPNFKGFRKHFNAEFLKGFVCPAFSFDNVKGNFPIGFVILNLQKKEVLEKIYCDIYDKNAILISKKTFKSNDNSLYLNNWISIFKIGNNENIGYLNCANNSFQNQKFVWISIKEQNTHCLHLPINIQNLINSCIYLTVRHGIEATWLNDRDQFLYPNNKWKKDIEFQNDCLTFTLFHSSNKISIKQGVNHWIPFSEIEVNAKERFESHFMISFISGIVIPNAYSELFEQEEEKFCTKREFSPEAAKVFDAGRELWKYYHAQQNINKTGCKPLDTFF